MRYVVTERNTRRRNLYGTNEVFLSKKCIENCKGGLLKAGEN